MDRYNNNNNQISSQKAYDNFINIQKSPETRKKYSYWLSLYLRYHNLELENLADLLLKDPKEIQEDLINYINILKENLAYATIKTRIYALYSFFEINDVVIPNKKKINRFFGENIKTVKDRAYTMEEIKKIIDASPLKYKVIVSLMVSTGCRVGAIADLTKSSLKKIEEYKLYHVSFYEKDEEEYSSYTTPECAKYIDDYFEFRERSGEVLTPQSPLIRNDFRMGDLPRILKPRPLITESLSVVMRQILIKARLRVSSPNKERKEVALNHGYRKFFNTNCIDLDMNLVSKELLMGHKKDLGLETSYYRPTDRPTNKTLREYLKVVDELTIDPSNKLKKENQELKQQGNDNKIIKQKFEQFEKEYLQTLQENIRIKQENIRMNQVAKSTVDVLKDLKRELNDKNGPIRKEMEEIVKTRFKQYQEKQDERLKIQYEKTIEAFNFMNEIHSRECEILSKKGIVTKEDEESIVKTAMESIKQNSPDFVKFIEEHIKI